MKSRRVQLIPRPQKMANNWGSMSSRSTNCKSRSWDQVHCCTYDRTRGGPPSTSCLLSVRAIRYWYTCMHIPCKLDSMSAASPAVPIFTTCCPVCVRAPSLVPPFFPCYRHRGPAALLCTGARVSCCIITVLPALSQHAWTAAAACSCSAGCRPPVTTCLMLIALVLSTGPINTLPRMQVCERLCQHAAGVLPSRPVARCPQTAGVADVSGAVAHAHGAGEGG